MDTDLEEIIRDRDNIILTPANIKSYMIMMLCGIEYLHANWILHRVTTSQLWAARSPLRLWLNELVFKGFKAQ